MRVGSSYGYSQADLAFSHRRTHRNGLDNARGCLNVLPSCEETTSRVS
jgi:hypothetical protein